MEGLSIVANSFAVVSVALQLSEVCIKLYLFWESIEEAPQEIAVIKEDLQYLISVFSRIESTEEPLGHCIAEGIRHCRTKVAVLSSIVEKFDDEFQSASRRRRLWTAFKAVTHDKHVRKFRESLNETKATLTLAMVHECIIKSPIYNIEGVNIFPTQPARSIVSKELQNMPNSPKLQLSAQKHVRKPSCSTISQSFFHPLPASPRDVARNALQYFEKVVPEQALANFTIQELMLHAISQTAIATFKSTSQEIFAQDGYMIDEYSQIRSKTFVYSAHSRYSVRHQTSSFRTALGCLWIRKTTIGHDNKLTGELETSQTVTSFVFYPKEWLQLLGVRNGLEAVTASAGRSWLYNCRLTVTRAVREDALIFELCSAGETRAVQLLLEKGHGSVVDTSPKGWKPLHFAAIAGHVDLCAMLIRAGADKSAHVYEGPAESVLSPISLFVSQCTHQSADDKIAMLRLFCDCIDLSESDSDGWIVHEWLKKAYAKERRPISQNSVTWLLHQTANEEYVEFSARAVWSGLQHAIRSVLNHEHFSGIIVRILDLSVEEQNNIRSQRINALGTWLALRVNGRKLLPMVVSAGSFLHMRGFDWTDDDIPNKEILQALPNIYASWCHAVLDAVERLEAYMREELEQCLEQLGLTREVFLKTISHLNTASNFDHGHAHKAVCTDCGDDYTILNDGLVEPARIAVTECVVTGHDFDCRCHCMENVSGPTCHPEHLFYTGTYHESDFDEEIDMNEEFFDAEPYLFGTKDIAHSGVFSDTATLLYRAHGRVWIGEYAIGERLCATCFLVREQYIGEDGLSADFPPMPRSFEGLRTKQ